MHFHARLLDAYCGMKTANAAQLSTVALLGIRRPTPGGNGIDGNRDINVVRLRLDRILKTGRHHANDREGLPI